VTDGRIKVLYIAGFGRNGSTILGNILGELDGFFHGGELNFVWERNLLDNRRCGLVLEVRASEPAVSWGVRHLEGANAREMTRLQSVRVLVLNTALTLLAERLRSAPLTSRRCE
jgi:hypothetical protein